MDSIQDLINAYIKVNPNTKVPLPPNKHMTIKFRCKDTDMSVSVNRMQIVSPHYILVHGKKQNIYVFNDDLKTAKGMFYTCGGKMTKVRVE